MTHKILNKKINNITYKIEDFKKKNLVKQNLNLLIVAHLMKLNFIV